MLPRARLSLPSAISALCLVMTVPVPAAAGPPGPPPPPRAAVAASTDIVPISTRGPGWYDLAYHRRVLAAGMRGVRLPPGARVGALGADMPATLGVSSPGIRPGLWLVSVTAEPGGISWCTANFVFARRGALAIGTAGHCGSRDSLGRLPDVTAYVVPPAGSGTAPGFFHIGRFVLVRNRGLGDDFGLIRIYRRYEAWVDPTMPVWGGPRGVYSSNATTVVQYFGHGAAVGSGGTPRAGAAPVWTARGGRAFAWYGPSSQGDSGAPVRTISGHAAGNLTHIVVARPGFHPGMTAGTRMPRILEIAAGWRLVNGNPSAIPAGWTGGAATRVVPASSASSSLSPLRGSVGASECANGAAARGRGGRERCALDVPVPPLRSIPLPGS